MTFKFGKTPARPGAVKLKFEDFFDAKSFPPLPARFGHYGLGAGLPWGTLGNDQYGDCVFAGAAHETMVWTHHAGTGAPAFFSDASVLSDYSAVTGFDPAKPDIDRGTDMQQAAAYRQKTGVVDAHGVRHKIDAYVSLRPGDWEQLQLAGYVTGAVGMGVRFPSTAMDQFSASSPWVVAGHPRIEGGHYVPFVGRNSAGLNLGVTWGRLQAFDDNWYDKYADEAICYVSFEFLDKRGVTPELYDKQALVKAVADLTA